MEKKYSLLPDQEFSFLDSMIQGMFGNMFSPDYPMPKFPEFNLPFVPTEEYESMSEDERKGLMDEFIKNNPFVEGLVNKFLDKNARAKLREMTSEIDAKIIELNKQREEIVRRWATGEY